MLTIAVSPSIIEVSVPVDVIHQHSFFFVVNQMRLRDTGVILSVADNVIIANGLFGSFVGEVVDFEISLKMLLDPLVEHEETKGLVMNLEEKLVRVVIYQGSMDFV